MQGYYRKSIKGIGEKMADVTWKRKDWHRLFRGRKTRENYDNNADGDNDDNYDNDDKDDDGSE